MNDKPEYITQIDYIKLLLEENRFGDALECMKILSTAVTANCEKIAKEISGSDIFFDKEQIKTKKHNHILINNVWCKVINKTSTEIEFEIMKDLSVIKTIKKSKININDSIHA